MVSEDFNHEDLIALLVEKKLLAVQEIEDCVVRKIEEKTRRNREFQAKYEEDTLLAKEEMVAWATPQYTGIKHKLKMGVIFGVAFIISALGWFALMVLATMPGKDLTGLGRVSALVFFVVFLFSFAQMLRYDITSLEQMAYSAIKDGINELDLATFISKVRPKLSKEG